jgi:hypothetical protein
LGGGASGEGKFASIRDEVDDCLLEEEEDDEDEVLTAEQDEALVGLFS